MGLLGNNNQREKFNMDKIREEAEKEARIITEFNIQRGSIPEGFRSNATDNLIERMALRIESYKRQLAEKETSLQAWQSAFGTTQLSHAIARLESAENKLSEKDREINELKLGISKRAESIDWLNQQLTEAKAEIERLAKT